MFRRVTKTRRERLGRAETPPAQDKEGPGGLAGIRLRALGLPALGGHSESVQRSHAVSSGYNHGGGVGGGGPGGLTRAKRTSSSCLSLIDSSPCPHGSCGDVFRATTATG